MPLLPPQQARVEVECRMRHDEALVNLLLSRAGKYHTIEVFARVAGLFVLRFEFR